jgi:hypothetical protein
MRARAKANLRGRTSGRIELDNIAITPGGSAAGGPGAISTVILLQGPVPWPNTPILYIPLA